MTRRARTAALTGAATAALTVAAIAVAPAASATATPVGEAVTTVGTRGLWSVTGTCHFGPTTEYAIEKRLYVQGAATAPGGVATTVRCVVESGNGVWTDTYAATVAGPVAVTAGDDWLWTTADRLCAEASALFPDGTVVSAPRVCV